MVHWIAENINLFLEIIAVALGIAYVILIAKNEVSGWIFGTIGSLVSILLFIRIKLYAEAFLYAYYVYAGIQGFILWKQQEDTAVAYKGNLKFHSINMLIGISLSFGLYFLLSKIFPDAARPLIDSFTTIFSFIATYLTIKKYIENWIYWIIVDGLTVYLYFSRDLYIYAGLMAAYTILALFGYLQWRKLKVIAK